MKRGGTILCSVATLAIAACTGASGKLEIRPTPTPLAAGERPVPFRVAEGYGQLALGNVGLALESFRKALREDGSSIEAMAGIATCYDRMARFDLSRRHYEAALAIAPRDTRLLTAFAASLDLQGRAMEAASVRKEINHRMAAAAPAVLPPAAPAVAAIAKPAPPAALPEKPAKPAPTVLAAAPKAPPAPLPRVVERTAAVTAAVTAAPAAREVTRPVPLPVAPAPRAVTRAAAAPQVAAPREVARVAAAAPPPAPRVMRVAAATPAPAVALAAASAATRAPVARPAPAIRPAPVAQPTIAKVQLALAAPAPAVTSVAEKPVEAVKVPPTAVPAPIAAARPAIGRSITVALPPARSVAEATPAKPEVETPAPAASAAIARPPARAAIAKAPVSARAGARLERMSLTEMALITTPGPQWRSLTVGATARSATVKFVPLRQASARPAAIRLLNAARVDRLAARTRAYLIGRGWRPMTIGNAQVVRDRSIIFYPAGRRRTAQTLSRQFGFAIAQRTGSRQITILLGRDAARVSALRARGG